jgi:hypothetical protein
VNEEEHVTLLSEAESDKLNGVTAADHVTLSRLLVENMWRVDHGAGDRVHELYAEDGEIRYEGKVFCKGHDAIKEWGRNRRDPDVVRHTITNLRFEADGPDQVKGTGTVVVYLAAERRSGRDATLPLLVGECFLWCRRTELGWLFTASDFHVMFDRRADPPPLF